MFMDAQALFLDNAAYNATVNAIDLGAVRPRGKQVKCFIHCKNGDMGGMTALAVTDGATSAAGDAYKSYTLSAAALNAGTFFFTLDADVARYVKIALTGATAGTGITAGVVLDEHSNF